MTTNTLIKALDATTGGNSSITDDGTTVATTEVTQITRAGIAVTSTDGLVLQNTTPAVSGTQQMPPRIHWIGRGFATGGGTSQSQDWIAEVLPAQGLGSTSQFILSQAQSGGAYTARFTLGSAGALTLTNNLTMSAGILAVTGGNITAGGSSGGATGFLKMFTGGVSNNVILQPTSGATSSWTMSLPTTGGTNHYGLHTDGAGVTSWALEDLTNGVTGILPVANGGSGTSTAFTQGSVVFAGASGVYTQDNSNFFWDATNHRLGLGTPSPTDKVHVTAGTLTDGQSAQSVTTTLVSTATQLNKAFELNVTTAGSSAQQQTGLNIDLNAGYTGSKDTEAIRIIDAVASTGTWEPIANDTTLGANNGVLSFMSQAGAGSSVALRGWSRSGTGVLAGLAGVVDVNGVGSTGYGVIGSVTEQANTNGTRVGVVGVANHSATINVGGYFGLNATPPTYVSAALIADNGSVASPIQLWRDNGTIQGLVDDAGIFCWGGTTCAGAAAKIDAAGNVSTSGTFHSTSTKTVGTCTYSSGVCSNITVSSGAICVCSSDNSTAASIFPCSASVSGTTLVVKSASITDSSVASYVCL